MTTTATLTPAQLDLLTDGTSSLFMTSTTRVPGTGDVTGSFELSVPSTNDLHARHVVRFQARATALGSRTMVDEDAVPEGLDRSMARHLVYRPDFQVGGSRGNSVRRLLGSEADDHGLNLAPPPSHEEGTSDWVPPQSSRLSAPMRYSYVGDRSLLPRDAFWASAALQLTNGIEPIFGDSAPWNDRRPDPARPFEETPTTADVQSGSENPSIKKGDMSTNNGKQAQP